MFLAAKYVYSPLRDIFLNLLESFRIKSEPCAFYVTFSMRFKVRRGTIFTVGVHNIESSFMRFGQMNFSFLILICVQSRHENKLKCDC